MQGSHGQGGPSTLRQAQDASPLHASTLRLAQGSAERVGRIIIRPYKNLAMIMISPCDRHDKRKIPRSARNGKKGSHQQYFGRLRTGTGRLPVLLLGEAYLAPTSEWFRIQISLNPQYIASHKCKYRFSPQTSRRHCQHSLD
jgi:hypothetical protein